MKVLQTNRNRQHFIPSCFGKDENTQSKIIENTNQLKPSITIAPNPAEDFAIINFKNTPKNSTIEVFDLTGRTIKNLKTDTMEGSFTVMTNSYPSGIYIIVMRNNGVLLTQQKLIIK